GVAGQFVDNSDMFGLLEAGKLARHGFANRLEIDLLAGFRYQHRDDALAEVRMRHADHGAFENPGLLVENELDLLRVDIVTAGDDEVLRPADDRDIAILVDHADVS